VKRESLLDVASAIAIGIALALVLVYGVFQ